MIAKLEKKLTACDVLQTQLFGTLCQWKKVASNEEACSLNTFPFGTRGGSGPKVSLNKLHKQRESKLLSRIKNIYKISY